MIQQLMAHVKRSRARWVIRSREEKVSAPAALPLIVGFTASKVTGSTTSASLHSYRMMILRSVWVVDIALDTVIGLWSY